MTALVQNNLSFLKPLNKTTKKMSSADGLGLEFTDVLTWSKWSPGEEYVKTITIKNVSTKTVKIRYTQPATRYFQIGFPEPIKLSAGMVATVTVTFCPVRTERYEDQIEFQTPNGGFTVQLRGQLPEFDLHIPERIDFGFRLVKDESTLPVKVVNIGKAEVKFSWKIGTPFEITPESGTLAPGAEMSFNCVFRPEAASVFTAAAVCMVHGGPTIPMKVHGIGKYAFIVLDKKSLDLGTVLLGKSVETTVKATNASTVPARFEVVPGGSDPNGTVFRVSPTHGLIAPGQSADLKVHFTPSFAGSTCTDTFTVRATGGNRCEFDVKGFAAQPSISLSSQCLNFGSVASGETVRRAVQIRNESPVEVSYQVQCEPGVFAFEKGRGTIPAHGVQVVTVSFRGEMPSQYWRRAAVVLAGGEPSYIDLLAAVYTEDSHPMPPSESQARVAWNFGLQAAEALLSEAPATRLPSASMSASSTTLAKLETAVREGASAADPWECVFTTGATAKAVSVDVHELDFGMCSRLRPIEPRLVTVTNRSSTKLSVFWATPGQAPAPGATITTPKTFFVLPEKMDLDPGAKGTFRISFRPAKDGQMYAQSADLFAAPKRPAPPPGANPRAQPQYLPLPLSIPVQGHTLQHLEANPRVDLSTSTVSFPPCHVGQASYQTLALTNNGVTPVSFEGHIQNAEGFTVFPKRGSIASGDTAILSIRFKGAESRPFNAKLMLKLNNSNTNIREVLLKAAAFLPSVSLEGGPSTFLRSTCVGTASETELYLRSASRAPIAFDIQVPEALREIISFEPSSGVLSGNQRIPLKCIFSPQKVRRYALAIPCRVVGYDARLGAEADAASEQVSVFNLVGEGTEGGIVLGRTSIDLGVVQVGSTASTSLSLLNKSGGALQFVLECLALDNEGNVVGPASDVTISPPSGLLSAHVEKNVSIQYSPGHRSPEVVYSIRCYTGTGGGGAVVSKEPTATCVLQARAEHPLLHVEDVYAPDGSGHKLPLWENANVTRINEELYRALAPDELALTTAFDEGIESGASVIHMLEGHGFPVVLPAGPLGAPPAAFTFRFKNPGPLEAHWGFSFPHEEDVESEPWVQPVWPPSHMEQVQSLFEIHPRAGKLKPGETVDVNVFYNRSLLGDHVLPVVLHVTQGRTMRLELSGTTCDPAEPRLGLPDGIPEHPHRFEDVEIGSMNPPLQPYVLHNASPNDLFCFVDLENVLALNAQEYDFPVMALTTPEMFQIPPNGSYTLYWRFNPLETGKTYSATVPITCSTALSDSEGEEEGKREQEKAPSRVYTMRLSGTGVLPKDEPGAELIERREGDYRRSLRQVPHACKIRPVANFASLSHSVLDLGEVPLHRPSTGVVAVTAAPGVPRPVAVAWEPHRSFGLANVPIAFEPATAILQPGETRLFRCSVGPHAMAAYLQHTCTLRAKIQPPPEAPAPLHRPDSADSDLTGAPSVRRSIVDKRASGLYSAASQSTTDAFPEAPEPAPEPETLCTLELRAFMHGAAPDQHPHVSELHREALRQWGAGALRAEQAGPAVAAELVMLFEEVVADLACDPSIYEAAAHQDRLELEGRDARAPTLEELGAGQEASVSAAAAAFQIEIESFAEAVLEGAVLGLLQETAALGLGMELATAAEPSAGETVPAMTTGVRF